MLNCFNPTILKHTMADTVNLIYAKIKCDVRNTMHYKHADCRH